MNKLDLPVLYDHEFGLLNEYGLDQMMKWMFNATPNWKVIEENNLIMEPEKVVKWSDDLDSIYKDGFFHIGCRTLTDGRTTAFELTVDVNPFDVNENKTIVMKYMTKDMAKELIKGLVKAVNDRFPVHDHNNFTELFKLHWTKAPVNCQECGAIIGYWHRAKEPELMITGGRLDYADVPQILFCNDCSKRFGEDWENEPFMGDFDDPDN